MIASLRRLRLLAEQSTLHEAVTPALGAVAEDLGGLAFRRDGSDLPGEFGAAYRALPRASRPEG